jgi:hypothetical protein
LFHLKTVFVLNRKPVDYVLNYGVILPRVFFKENKRGVDNFSIVEIIAHRSYVSATASVVGGHAKDGPLYLVFVIKQVILKIYIESIGIKKCGLITLSKTILLLSLVILILLFLKTGGVRFLPCCAFL